MRPCARSLFICRLPCWEGEAESFLNSPCLQEQGEKTYGKLSLSEHLCVYHALLLFFLIGIARLYRPPSCEVAYIPMDTVTVVGKFCFFVIYNNLVNISICSISWDGIHHLRCKVTKFLRNRQEKGSKKAKSQFLSFFGLFRL